MFTFERKANYYETDQMGIVHHSNYIRWFEEARLEMLRAMGLPYKKMEDNGILIPVLRQFDQLFRSAHLRRCSFRRI